MNYTVIDIETTGLKPEEGAEITEIAGINVSDCDVITTFSSLVKINGEINNFIENLTGINNEMCKNALDFNIVLKMFFDTLNIGKGTNIVIHNAEFDYNFIKYYIDKNMSSNYSERFQSCNVICSLELARRILPNESHKLEHLKDKFGIKSKSHRALNDVLVTNKVFAKLKELEKEDIDVIL